MQATACARPGAHPSSDQVLRTVCIGIWPRPAAPSRSPRHPRRVPPRSHSPEPPQTRQTDPGPGAGDRLRSGGANAPSTRRTTEPRLFQRNPPVADIRTPVQSRHSYVALDGSVMMWDEALLCSSRHRATTTLWPQSRDFRTFPNRRQRPPLLPDRDA